MSTNEKSVSVSVLETFLENAPGLHMSFLDDETVQIEQEVDSKQLQFKLSWVEEVLERRDGVGKPFLQVNFHSGQKILLTRNLVGFKPTLFEGMEMKKVPNVVTTPDLLSIIEAMSDFDAQENSVEWRALRRMYFAILHGAEAVGFEVSNEKLWVTQIQSTFAA